MLAALRVAHEYRLPPTRYLRLPWPEWGETDFVLTQALRRYEESLCPCGCGVWAQDAHDPLNEGSFEVTDARCYARLALNDWRSQNKEAPDDTLLAVRLPTANQRQSAEQRAAADIADMMRRHGLTEL